MERYLAVLDILGYKSLLLNNDLSEVQGLLDNIPVYVQGSLAEGKTISTNGQVHYDVKNASINSIIISDTFIFWTIDNSQVSLWGLIDCIYRLMQFCHNLPSLFLRGAIIYGEFIHKPTGYILMNNGAIMSHPMIYGKGLIQAYDIEKRQAIANCLIQNEAIEKARESDPKAFEIEWSNLQSGHRIIHYEVPMKEGNLFPCWVINWVSQASNPTREKLLDKFSLYNRNTDDPSIQLKIINTVRFYDFVKQSQA